MQHTLSIVHLLDASEASCSQAVCSIIKAGGELENLMYENTRKEYFSLLERVPKDFSKALVHKAAIYNSGYSLYKTWKNKDVKNSKSINGQIDSLTVTLASIKIQRPRVKEEWLLDHEKFVMDLHIRGASYRKISEAIKYRFRTKISYEQIRLFVIARKGVVK